MRVEFTSEPYVYGPDLPAEGVSISVCYSETKLLVPIYRDALSSDRAANPIVTDYNGVVHFWVEPGYYTLVAQGVATNVTIGDPDDADPEVSMYIIGPPGPPGAPGGVVLFTFVQATPVTTAVIDHPLNTKPDVLVVDSLGKERHPDVDYPTDFRVVLTFTHARAFTAYLRG